MNNDPEVLLFEETTFVVAQQVSIFGTIFMAAVNRILVKADALLSAVEHIQT